MKISDIFSDIFKGFDIQENGNYEPYKAYLIDTRDVINCRVNYSESNLKEIKSKYKDKYFLKANDIIVSTRSSLLSRHVGYIANDKNRVINNFSEIKLIPKKNFIVLRGCNELYYLPSFVANYLEYIGIDNYFKYSKEESNQLTIQLIEDIVIPKISLAKQQELLRLLNPINERSYLYKKMIANDIEISKYAISEVLKNEK
jgi:RAB protein geranylgeranyltransferase component A